MKTTIEKIAAALEADATLAAYIKAFTKGGVGKNQLLFPFVNIGPISFTRAPQSIGPRGSDEITFTVLIEFGTRSSVPELAFFGDATNKGIVDVADDIETLCTNNLFDGAFTRPADVSNARTDFLVSPGEWTWVGEIAVVGRRKVARTQPV